MKRSLLRYKLTPSGTNMRAARLNLLTAQWNSIQDALRGFLPPTKYDDARLDFYTVYKKEATEYDTDYIKKYDEDLNTTLIFVCRLLLQSLSTARLTFSQAGLFSAVSSAFVIDVQPKLQPDPNEQSAAILRAILLTLNQSAIPGETPTVPPAQEDPPNEIVTVSGLMYASLLISLLAAFVAMLGKQWLNRYLRNEGRSMVERCGDRQRKFDGLQKWPFHLFIESLPMMLQAALLLLACGLCRHVASINTAVAGVFISLTALGVLFYLVIVVSGASSYACPFQTPASTALRNLWKKIRPQTTLPARPVVTAGTYLSQVLSYSILHPLWKEVVCPIILTIHHLRQVTMQAFLNFNIWLRVTFRLRLHVRHPSPAISLQEIREDSHIPPESNSSLHSNDPSPHETNPPLTPDACTPRHETNPSTLDADPPRHNTNSPSQETNSSSQDTPTPAPGDAEPWLVREGLTTVQKTNAKDDRCVSWILRNITDPEAVDAAIRFACTVRWFEDGIDFEVPYNVIVSTFHSCLDSTGIVYRGSRDRAYYSAQAILWIHICAMCVSEQFANRLPLPFTRNSFSYDFDLHFLLEVYGDIGSPVFSPYRSIFTKLNTPAHMRWVSNAFLHFCWTRQGNPDMIGRVIHHNVVEVPWDNTPLDAILNLCLVWSIYLGCPVEEEMLKIQDKVYVVSRSLLRIT